MSATTSGCREISESVLLDRINERLTSDGEDLKDSRMSESPSIGHFYEHQESFAEPPGLADLETIGRELGVLMPGETLSPDK